MADRSAKEVDKFLGKGAYGGTEHVAKMREKTKKEVEQQQNSPTQSGGDESPFYDYSSAVSYLKSQGVEDGAGIMTATEWIRRKGKQGGTYQQYLNETVKKFLNRYQNESKSAYDTAKAQANSKTTFQSPMTEKERKARIVEIEEELIRLGKVQSGLSRGAVYANLSEQIEKVGRDEAALREELKQLKRVGTFSKADLIQHKIDDKNEEILKINNEIGKYGQRPSKELGAEYAEKISQRNKLQAEVNLLKQQKELMEDITDFGETVNEDTFVGQWKANYRSNELGREANKAINRYLDNPTPENLQIALAYDELTRRYAQNNQDALDDENVKLSWLTKDLAGYLPQLKDQAIPEKVGGVVGGILGSAVGLPTVGYGVGSGLVSGYMSYRDIRGAVYRELRAQGASESVALEAAQDEALLSAVIEGGASAVDALITGGVGAQKVIGSAAVKSVANGSTNVATRFVANMATKATSKTTAKLATKAASEVATPLWKTGLKMAGGLVGNAASEYVEEFTQQGVSRANKKRGIDTDKSLVWGATKEVFNAVTGKDKEAFDEMHEAGSGGFKIGLMMGGTRAIVNNTIAHYASAKTVAQQNEIADAIIEDEESLTALIEEGKASGEGTVSAKIATKVEEAKEKGNVTREQVKQLIAANDVYIKSEEQATVEADTRANDARTSQTGTPTRSALNLNARSEADEPIDINEVKQETRFGDKGAELVTNLANTEGTTYTQAKEAVQTAYLAGYTNQADIESSLKSEVEKAAFNAGMADRSADDSVVSVNSKQATTYNTGFTENEHSAKLNKAERRMFSFLAKDLKMEVSMIDEIIASYVDGKPQYANASHTDGKLEVALNSDNTVVEDAMHESGHRMAQLDTMAWNTLMDALYAQAEQLGTRASVGAKHDFLFDSEKVGHDESGVTLGTRDLVEEIAVQQLSTIWKSPEAFNKWRKTLNTNPQVKSAWKSFLKWMRNVIENIKRRLSMVGMSKAEKAEARKAFAEADRMLSLFENAYVASMQSADARANEAAFEAGKANVPRENVTLATKAQEDAYNKGRLEHIKNLKNKPVVNEKAEAKKDVTEQPKKAQEEQKQSYTQSDGDVSESKTNFSLKNKNLNINSRIPYTEIQNYIKVGKNDAVALGRLETKVRNIPKGTYQNDATGYRAEINADTIRKAIHPTHKNFDVYSNRHIRNLNAMVKLPELFKNAVYVDSKPPQKAKNMSVKEYHHFVAPLFMNNGEYRALITARANVNSDTLYVLRVEVLPTQKKAHSLGNTANAGGSQWVSAPSDISIPELVKDVKIKNYDTGIVDTYSGKDIKFSLKDSKGRTLTEGQQEYFKDSKVRDENGNLLVMYRGDSENITVFDRKKSKYSNLYGRGFYFTAVESHAGQYGNVKAYYLNIKHPVSTQETTITKAQLRNFLEAVAENEDYGLENYGYDATVDSVLQSTYGKSDFLMLYDINQTAIGDLVKAVELFNEVNGTDFDGFILDTETVTFNSEQAKLTSNENPTNNPDTRFSLKKSVEETKDLIAVHNMQVSELERTLDLGGLPMPSIAIIKAQSGHSEYGDVSLVFNKDTIDPKADKNNKVYGGDAWTPTYPQIEYKPSDKIADKISDKYYELSKKFGYDESRPLYNYVHDLERQLNTKKGETGLIEELYDDTKMMQLYLLDSGKDKVETVKKETRTELTDAEVEMNEFFINALGANVVDEVKWDGNGTPIAYRKNYMSKYEDAIRETYKKLLSEVYQFSDEQVQNVLDSTKPVDYLNFVRNAYKYRQDGRVTIKTEDDYSATEQAIRDAVGDDYRKWIDSLFKGIEEKSGIRNNADYFTNSGNRRNWEALHWENNLENVVKVMKSQDDTGGGFFGGQGIWGVSAKNYRSVEEIKADSDRLKQMPEEEYQKIKDGFGDRMSEIAHSIMDKSERNPFIAVDNAMECIVDAVRQSKTKSGLFNNLKQYQHLTVTQMTVDDIISLVNDISNMPTEYFEAKPKRAVELNEIATAIIPDSTSESTKARLSDMGIKYLEYEAGNEDARMEALNSLEDSKFSLKKSNTTSAQDTKELLETIEHLKHEFEVTKFAKADPKKLAKMTREILKDYDSKADLDETFKAVDELYKYMANGEGGHPAAWNDVYDRAYNIARGIVENAVVLDDEMYQEYKSLRDYLRKTPMKFIPIFDSVPTSYETFNDFRKHNMGRLKFTNDGMSIDSVYQELASLYPEFFDAEEQTDTADMLERIEEVLDEIQPTEVNPFDSQMEQATSHLANDLTSRFFDIPQAKPTFADKAEQKVVKERIKGNKKLEAERLRKEEKIKKVIEKQRKKTKEQLDKVRQQRDAKVAKEKEKRNELRKKVSESQHAKELRAKIMRHTAELSKTLRKATDKKHIPPELENAVTALLYNINLESNYTYDVESDSYKKNDKGLPTNKTQAFLGLKEVYAQIAKNNDYNLSLAPELIGASEEGIGNLFDEVMKLSNKKIADMTSKELTTIYDAMRIIEHSIAVANKAFAVQKWATFNEMGKAFDESTKTRRPIHPKMKTQLFLDVKTPLTFFSELGEAGVELYNTLRAAQDQEQVMTDELAELVSGIVSLEQVKKANKDIHKFTTAEGKKLTLTQAHIMNIYLLYNREQGKKHLLFDPENGYTGRGIHQPEVKRIRRDSEPTRLTKSDLDNILSKLDKEHKDIADKLQKATLKLAEWGNKACKEVFGYEKFKDSDYWTIMSASESIHQDTDKKVDKPRSIKNIGSGKPTNDLANNAVNIDGVFDVFAKHASEMISYSTWLAPMEDMSRLFNYNFRDENGNITGRTFRSMLDKYVGAGGAKYYSQLMDDIQNGIGKTPDTNFEKWYTKLYGAAAKAAVSFKTTVVAQQPMAIVRATTVMNPKYIIEALAKGAVDVSIYPVVKVKNLVKNTDGSEGWYGGWQRALKYAPIAARKAAGGYEMGANSVSLSSMIYQPDTKWGKTKDFIKESPLWAAGKGDEITWGILWNACEFEMKKNKSLEKGSEEFYKAVARRFTDIINQTQVVDGVLQRSQAMRSSSGWVRPLTSFKGEPTMALNAVIRAYENLRYEKDPQRRGHAKRRLSRTAFVFVASAIFTAFARSLAVGVTGEEDEEYWEKVWKSFSGIQGDEETWFDYFKNITLKSDAANNMNPASLIPFMNEVMSLMQGYDVERLDVSSIGDFVTAGQQFISSLDEDGKYTVGYALRKMLLKGVELTGWAPNNLIRDIEGAIRTARNASGDLMGVYEMEKWKTKIPNNTSKYVDILYRAYSTDDEDYEDIYNDLMENGGDEEKIKNGMEARMKKDEGVQKSTELSKRWMNPETEKKYDNSIQRVQSSEAWGMASEEQKKKAKSSLYSYLTSDSKTMVEKREEAKKYDVDETELILWELASEMADDAGKDNDYVDAKEKKATLETIDLDNSAIAYFYDTKTSAKAYENDIDMYRFAMFMGEISGIEGKGKTDKIKAIARKYAANERERVFFVGSGLSNYKKKPDYIRYFGKDE